MITPEVFIDIISLHRQGLSMRAIAKKLGIRRNTLKKHIEENRFPQYRKCKRQESILDPFRQAIDDFLAQDDPWLPGFWLVYKRWVIPAPMKFTGPSRQGNYQIKNPDGSISTKYMFLMILGYSRAKYIEIVDQCSLKTFMDCYIHAFHYLQGVLAEILYDNMKQLVIGRNRGKAVLNNEFLHFVHNYSFTPKACPPYSPWAVIGLCLTKYFKERNVEILRVRVGPDDASLATLFGSAEYLLCLSRKWKSWYRVGIKCLLNKKHLAQFEISVCY